MCMAYLYSSGYISWLWMKLIVRAFVCGSCNYEDSSADLICMRKEEAAEIVNIVAA